MLPPKILPDIPDIDPRPGDPCLSCFCMNGILGTPFRLILYTTIPVHPVLVCYAGVATKI
jgi:hypothetical protein